MRGDHHIMRSILPTLMLVLIAAAALSCAGPAVVDRERHDELLDLCSRFLDDYSNKRFEAIEARFAPGAVVAIDSVDNDRQLILSAEEFLARSRRGGPIEEWISGPATVLSDHKVACVWAPYMVEEEDGSSAGFDVFQLINIDGEWRIICLSYTNRNLDR